MPRIVYVIAYALLIMAPALRVEAQQPPFATTKVDGTDNVYIFRAGNAQAMFVVTPAGVIATDPIGYARRDAAGHLHLRDSQDHESTDSLSHLQPSPFRSYCRRSGLQGRGRYDHRARACKRSSAP